MKSPSTHSRSLGWKTHLIFPAFEGEITRPDQSDYLVVRTKTNPTHYWGNFLLFDAPPQPGDLSRWEAAFAREIGPPETIAHKAFGWDSVNGETGDAAAFLAAGYEMENAVVMAARAEDLTRPVRFSETVKVRALKSDADWDATVQNKVDTRGEAHPDEALYRTFKEKQMARFRRMSEAKRGEWYGAFLENRLVGDCGLFWAQDDGSGEPVARFQSVGVHPDFRRRGVCGAMIWHIAHQAFAHSPHAVLVLVADAHYHAQAIYHALGFRVVETQESLQHENANSFQNVVAARDKSFA